MYAYYVAVPRIFICGSNFQFIPSVEFLEIFTFFVLAHSAHSWQFVLTYTHIIWCLLNVFEDNRNYSLSFTMFWTYIFPLHT